MMQNDWPSAHAPPLTAAAWSGPRSRAVTCRASSRHALESNQCFELAGDYPFELVLCEYGIVQTQGFNRKRQGKRYEPSFGRKSSHDNSIQRLSETGHKLGSTKAAKEVYSMNKLSLYQTGAYELSI